jgi:hypothetical protein
VTVESNRVPLLYEWLGGAEVLKALMVKFYERVSADELLRPLFGEMPRLGATDQISIKPLRTAILPWKYIFRRIHLFTRCGDNPHVAQIGGCHDRRRKRARL